MAEQLVQLHLAQHRAQRGLRKLRGLVDVVGHLDGGVVGVDHVERDHGVHLEGDVVAGDHVLRGNLQHLLAQRDAHHLVEGPEDQMMPGPFGRRAGRGPGEDDAALVLAEDLDGVEQVEDDDGDENQNRVKKSGIGIPSLTTDCTPAGS
jgi:hypothetical protein